MVSAFERKHQTLAALGIAHQFQGVFDGLRSPDVEVDAAMLSPGCFGMPGDQCCQFNFLAMQILTGELRQASELIDQGFVQAQIRVAEIDGRIPHLKIEIGSSICVEEKRALTAFKEFRLLHIVNGITMRTVASL